MGGWGWFFLLFFLFLILGAVGWVIFTRRRASQQGLPPPTLKSYIPFAGSSNANSNYPSPRQGGIIGWFKDQIANLKSRRNRTAHGAYEEPLEGRVGRGRGAGDEEAWDARMGASEYDGPGSYYEEQEPNLRPEPYTGSAYGAGGSGVKPTFGADTERGRSRSRDAAPYLGAGGTPSATGENPFEDSAEAHDPRGVSPRPHLDTDVKGKGLERDPSKAGNEDSPTERRSMFRESL